MVASARAAPLPSLGTRPTTPLARSSPPAHERAHRLRRASSRASLNRQQPTPLSFTGCKKLVFYALIGGGSLGHKYHNLRSCRKVGAGRRQRYACATAGKRPCRLPGSTFDSVTRQACLTSEPRKHTCYVTDQQPQAGEPHASSWPPPAAARFLKLRLGAVQLPALGRHAAALFAAAGRVHIPGLVCQAASAKRRRRVGGRRRHKRRRRCDGSGGLWLRRCGLGCAGRCSGPLHGAVTCYYS